MSSLEDPEERDPLAWGASERLGVTGLGSRVSDYALNPKPQTRFMVTQTLHETSGLSSGILAWAISCGELYKQCQYWPAQELPGTINDNPVLTLLT